MTVGTEALTQLQHSTINDRDNDVCDRPTTAYIRCSAGRQPGNSALTTVVQWMLTASSTYAYDVSSCLPIYFSRRNETEDAFLSNYASILHHFQYTFLQIRNLRDCERLWKVLQFENSDIPALERFPAAEV